MNTYQNIRTRTDAMAETVIGISHLCSSLTTTDENYDAKINGTVRVLVAALDDIGNELDALSMDISELEEGAA